MLWFILFFVVWIIAMARYHSKQCTRAQVLIATASIEYPEIEDILNNHPEFYNRLVDEVDTLLPNLIDVIIERRLSN